MNQLIVEITFADAIDPRSFHYFFAINTDPNATGPVPVVASPWGNGWGAGRITHFVQVAPAYPIPTLYRFTDPTDMTGAEPVQGGVLVYEFLADSRVLRFTLDLDRLNPPAADIPETIDFNIITTNRLPQGPNVPAPDRVFDALGPGARSEPIEINLRQDGRIYQNGESISTPEGDRDVSLQALDIIDWKIEVQRES